MQTEIDFTVHKKENNPFSEGILFEQYERLSNNCKRLYDAFKRGEVLTGSDIVGTYRMLEYRRRIKDLRESGIDIKEEMIGNGCKKWWIEK